MMRLRLPSWVLLLVAVTTGTVEARLSSEYRFYVKPGATMIDARLSSGELVLGGLDDTAQLALEPGAVAGSGVTDSGAATRVSATLGWRLPWGGGHWAVETILAPPFTFEFEATGTLARESLAPEAGGIPTGVPALGRELGETDLLPPVVTVVYTPWPDSRFSPYVGAGVVYVFSYNSRITNRVLTESASPELKIDNVFSYVLQLGLDVAITERLFVNVDYKYVGRVEPRARLRGIGLASDVELFDPIEVERGDLRLEMNPHVFGASVGWRF
ncbi:MAG: OmpW family protein [Ectothiorhodospiraceae bacterium]|nr:OmpW family protein [Ectothiorhodospiraceae bacterium]MCH8503009.1 outer membrane beta-barrel protein [Ectothiorhodospiraceae bacterium]